MLLFALHPSPKQKYRRNVQLKQFKQPQPNPNKPNSNTSNPKPTQKNKKMDSQQIWNKGPPKRAAGVGSAPGPLPTAAPESLLPAAPGPVPPAARRSRASAARCPRASAARCPRASAARCPRASAARRFLLSLLHPGVRIFIISRASVMSD
uniref:uncharacterized protein LOC108950925 isoform X2 n=1 Tax=Ciona intestinalis TaxID=7719 RepID=UPI000EF4F81A|nr:uncharacterized protein LOC108950925 isoform X2 [Ciona intestinalis]|eukprot:XP_026696043.1 uncharacterized protein LOC108950925 isoform X2 [Ciona intestinalis]